MDKKVQIIAHRGFSSQAPENTILAFDRALQLGVDMIELDVHLTEDEQIVVLHDDTLERTTNGKGKVYQKSSSYIKSLDAGVWFNKGFGQERVPFLSDVFDWSKGRVKILVEVKGNLEYYPSLPKVLTDLIKGFSAIDYCIIQSFNYAFLKSIYQLAPELTYYQLFDEGERISTKFDNFIQAVNPNYLSIKEEWVRDVHTQNLMVFPYTVNTLESMKAMIKAGVDGIITDYPDILKQLLNDS